MPAIDETTAPTDTPMESGLVLRPAVRILWRLALFVVASARSRATFLSKQPKAPLNRLPVRPWLVSM